MTNISLNHSKKAMGVKALKQEHTLLLWTIPFCIFIIGFSYIPLFGWLYAFFDYKVGTPLFQSEFLGIEHFIEVFSTSTSDIMSVLLNTLAMNFLNIIVSPLAIIFAIMLNEVRNTHFKKIVQTVTTLPNFISWIIVYAIAFSIFSNEGMFNQLLLSFGFNGNTNILGDNTLTWFFQTAMYIWKSLGWNAIIYIAAISSIDDELYDAAKIDGAGLIQRIWHITIPGIIPTFVVLMLLTLANMLSGNFDQYFVFYNSLVADKIEVIDYYAYRVGLLMNDYSLGTAISILKSVASIILLFSVNKLSKIFRDESLF